MYSGHGDLKEAGFPHSEICGSKPICRLPAAYRRLSRPSSPVIAKASTTCTYSLDPITLLPRFKKHHEVKFFAASRSHRPSRACASIKTNKFDEHAIHHPVCVRAPALQTFARCSGTPGNRLPRNTTREKSHANTPPSNPGLLKSSRSVQRKEAPRSTR